MLFCWTLTGQWPSSNSSALKSKGVKLLFFTVKSDRNESRTGETIYCCDWLNEIIRADVKWLDSISNLRPPIPFFSRPNSVKFRPDPRLYSICTWKRREISGLERHGLYRRWTEVSGGGKRNRRNYKKKKAFRWYCNVCLRQSRRYHQFVQK